MVGIVAPMNRQRLRKEKDREQASISKRQNERFLADWRDVSVASSTEPDLFISFLFEEI